MPHRETIARRIGRATQVEEAPWVVGHQGRHAGRAHVVELATDDLARELRVVERGRAAEAAADPALGELADDDTGTLEQPRPTVAAPHHVRRLTEGVDRDRGRV